MVLTRVLTGIALALALAGGASAQQDKAAREQVRRLQAELQRARQDKSQADAQLAEAKKQAEETAGKLGAAEGATAKERRARAAVEGEVAKLKGELAEQEKKLKDAQGAIEAQRKKEGELGKTLAERGEAANALQAALAQEKKARAVCEDKNAKLYQYGQEVLERYRTKTVWDVVTREEPFTGIKAVEVQNVVQEYRDKLGDQRVEPPVDGKR